MRLAYVQACSGDVNSVACLGSVKEELDFGFVDGEVFTTCVLPFSTPAAGRFSSTSSFSNKVVYSKSEM